MLESAKLALKNALKSFLSSGGQSCIGKNDDPPDREMLRRGGEVHDAVCKVQSCYPNDHLPSDIITEWHALCEARDDKSLTDKQWHSKARKYANGLMAWTENRTRTVGDDPPSLTPTEKAIIHECDGEKLTNPDILARIHFSENRIEMRSLKVTVKRLIELGYLYRPDGPNSRKGVTKVVKKT